MWNTFKLVKHKDGTYRCKNGFLDVLFLITATTLVGVAGFLSLFSVHIKMLDDLLGTCPGDFTKEEVEEMLRK